MAVELARAGQAALLAPGRLALLSGAGAAGPAPGPSPAPAPPAGADTFTSGIFFPSTVYAYSGGGSGQPLGSGFVRGLAGPPTITLTGPDAGGLLYLGGPNGMTLYTAGLYYFNPAKPSYSVTINATDGTATLPPLTVTIVSAPLALALSSNFVLANTMAADAGAPRVAGYGINGAPGAWSGAAPALADASGKFALDPAAGAIDAAPSALPLNGSYGAYPVNISVPAASGPAVVQATTLWVIAEKPPLVQFIPSGLALFTNTQTRAAYTQGHAAPGATWGQVRAYADSGIASISITSPGNMFAINTLDEIYVANPPQAGANQVATVTATSVNGQVARLSIPYSVGAGTTLPASAITATLSTALDNSMANGIAGSLAVAGLAQATWSVIVQDDECQELTAYSGGVIPRYSIVATGALTADLRFATLSAQTDSLLIEANDGAGTLARTVVPLTAAAKAGRTVSVGSASDGSGTAYDYPTWNAVGDAYWTDPAGNAGLTIVLHPQDYSKDFSRYAIGHGSNQQYFPGPATLKGLSAAARTLIDFKGEAPGLAAQGGVISQNYDQVFQYLDIRNVTNIKYGEGNAGGIYKTAQTPGNLTILDSALCGSDINVMNGDLGNHLVIERTWLAFGGAGAGGLTHNLYAGHFSSVTATDVLSFSTAQVHEFKCRAARAALLRCILVDGENGSPGASACADFPLGGIVTMTDCVVHKGPNPNNDGNMVQFCPEIGNGGLVGGNWPENTLVIDGTTFLNTASPHPLGYSGGITGVALWGLDGKPYDSLVTGVPASVVVKNSRFYNLPQAQWFGGAYGGGAVTDGGGNTALLTWPGLQAIDPATGALITAPPGPAYGTYTGYQGIVVPPLSLELRAAAGAAAGTAVTVATAYDGKGVPLHSTAWAITSQLLVTAAGSPGTQAAGTFAIAAQGGQGAVTTAGSIADGLYFILLAVSGTDSLGAAQSYEKWLFVVGGAGTVAAA